MQNGLRTKWHKIAKHKFEIGLNKHKIINNTYT